MKFTLEIYNRNLYELPLVINVRELNLFAFV